jgi:hypothetical protein
MALHPLAKPRANDNHKRLSTHQLLLLYCKATVPSLHEFSKKFEWLLLRYMMRETNARNLRHGPRVKAC